VRTARPGSASPGATLLLLAGALGCGEPAGTSAGQLEILAGANIVDTALARPAQAVVVRVRGAGSGEQVVFEAVESPLDEYPTTVSRLGTGDFGPEYADTTDSRGQLAARLWLGPKAGPSFVRIRVPSSGSVDSVRVTIRPAALFNLSADPSDTTIVLGGSSSLRVATSDVNHNARTGDPFTLRPLDGVTTVSGSVIRGAALGRGTLEISAGTLSGLHGNLYVSVAPAVDLGGITNRGVVAVRSDGTNFRLQIPVPLPSLSAPNRTSWVADGSAVVFDAVGILYWARRNGTWRQLTDGVEAANAPSVTSDGQWVYYARQTQGTWRIHRVRTDATGDELVLGAAEPLTWPTPSPDGRLVAFIAGNRELRILTLATGAVRSLDALATTPSWSPDGSELAFVCGDHLCAIRPDGTGRRSIGTQGGYNPGVEWSPDGRWLLTHNFVVQLVDASSGLAVPLTTPFPAFILTWAR
jgi:hypothetical protein